MRQESEIREMRDAALRILDREGLSSAGDRADAIETALSWALGEAPAPIHPWSVRSR